jgi:signal transduction histidine kinase
MGRETLKHTLSQQVRLLEHDYIALSHTSTTWNELQVRSLDTLVFNIQRLMVSINSLSDGPMGDGTRHELRNQLTVVLGFAQVMMHRRAGELSAEAMTHLQSIALVVDRINQALERDQRQARNA